MSYQRIIKFVLLSGLFTLVACGELPTKESAVEVLIQGDKGLENFRLLGDANWRAEGGAILADAGGEGFLVTKNAYQDFRMIVEFWADHTTNSGIFLRMSDLEQVTSANAYEVNIFDRRPDPLYGTGAIVDAAKVDPMPKVGGKWNTYDITAKGSHLIVRLNGEETANVEVSKHAKGPIAFQFGTVPDGEPGAIKWRKVTIQSF